MSGLVQNISNGIVAMPNHEIARHRTAIRRFSYSRPISLALAHQIITSDLSVFDYGCGRGEDVKYLRAEGIEATEWDPHYQPNSRMAPADVVNLGYVINVIEDPVERAETLGPPLLSQSWCSLCPCV